jgi:hypothetical protein
LFALPFLLIVCQIAILLAFPAIFLLKAQSPQLLFCAAEDDSDMKIAQDSFRPGAAAAEDAAEKAAQEFLHQRDNGNIERARQLGQLFAADLQQFGQSALRDVELRAVTQQEHHHQLLLCSYIINRVIAEHSPSQILAQTSSSMFYKQVESLSRTLYQDISDTAAFSLYILNERLGSPEDIGHIYARLLGAENDLLLAQKGNRLYSTLYQNCRERILSVNYTA